MSGRILYIQYTNPAGYPPLEHSSRILADAGWEVLFLGTGAYGADALRFRSHQRVVVKRLPVCPAGWRQKLQYLWFCLWVLVWTLRWRPAWLYVSDPLGCPAALLPAALVRRRVVYHEHDSPPSEQPSGRFMRLVLTARRLLAHRAALCVLPNERRMERFAQEMGPRVKLACVWNCPSRGEVGPPREPCGGADLWLLYHGSIVPSRLPLTVVEALALLPDRVKLRVIGYETIGHRGYAGQLQQAAAARGLAQRLDVVGAVAYHQLLERVSACDIGLAFMPRSGGDLNQNEMVGASNKPFDYLARGLALLVSDLPGWRRLYVDPGYGLACDPTHPASIAQAVQWLLEHPAELRAMGERGRQRIATEWNYETQFARVRLE